MNRFEIHPVESSTLPEVALFLERQLQRPAQGPTGVARRLNWLLVENPAAQNGTPFGYCLRNGDGAMRGLSLSFPATFLAGDRRISGLGSGSFYVDPPARSSGFFLFKRYLRTPGYAFHFASTCNAVSSELWRNMGGSAVPDSEADYIVPLRLGAAVPGLLASRTRNAAALGFARLCGRAADPLWRVFSRHSPELSVAPCRDWQKLADLSIRHRPLNHITYERSAAFLEWRYGPGSPLYPCGVYLVRDPQGHEGWFALGDLSRGKPQSYREAILLDAVWPESRIPFRDLFHVILQSAAEQSGAIYFRGRPGIDLRPFRPWAIRRKLAAPRAYAIAAKGAPPLPIDSLEYDDSDYVAWRFD